MTNGVTNEVIAGRLQVVLGDVDLFRIPRVPDPSRRTLRKSGWSSLLWIRI